MVYFRSRKFCCCLPVRFGVFVLVILGTVGGAIIAAGGWLQVKQLRQHPLQKSDRIALLLHGVIYTLLAVVSLFGLIGAITKKRAFIKHYSTMLVVHLGFSIGSGIFTLYSIFRKNSQDAVDNCINGTTSDKLTVDVCRNGIALMKGAAVAIFVITWLVQLYGCIIVANYVEQLEEEDAVKWPSKTITNISNPVRSTTPIATTYNSYTPNGGYAFTKTDQSFGVKGSNV